MFLLRSARSARSARAAMRSKGGDEEAEMRNKTESFIFYFREEEADGEVFFKWRKERLCL